MTIAQAEEYDPPLRFVVLHHTGFGDAHFDIMIESAPGSKLITWRSSSWPILDFTEVTRLPDHRSAYLEYEGPVSGNRGNVTRICSGSISRRSTRFDDQRTFTGMLLHSSPTRELPAYFIFAVWEEADGQVLALTKPAGYDSKADMNWPGK